MQIIDVKGKACPMPLIETKKALDQATAGEPLRILLDSVTSARNVATFLKDNDVEFEQTTTGNEIEIRINANGKSLAEVDEKSWCAPGNNDGSYVVLMAKDRIGEGSAELGEALAGAMINTLKVMEPLPQKIIFMNSGIHLVTNGSRMINDLKLLQEKGVDMLVCGACLDYFGKIDELAVGRISNMLDILQTMKDAGKVLNF
jgi:selenium metabolism protein YedF